VPNPNQLIVPADPAAHQSASTAYQVAAMAQFNTQKQSRSVPWNKEQMQSHQDKARASEAKKQPDTVWLTLPCGVVFIHALQRLEMVDNDYCFI
jgi:hypothetical protein